MSFDSHANLLKVTVTVAPTTPTAGLTLSVSNADAATLRTNLPAPFNVTVCPSTGNIDPTTSEIIRVSAIGSDNSGGTGNAQLTIARQAETGGVNRSIVVGDLLKCTITKKSLTDIENNMNAIVVNQVPSGTVDGSNTVFTSSQAFIGGTLQVYRDGQLLKGSGNDYTETTPSSGTFTFVAAPVSGSVILITYQTVAAGTGVNAATVNGYSANATPTANQIPVLDANGALPYSDGWTPTVDTWTFVDTKTMKIVGLNRTTIYQKGTLIKCTNNGATYYGTVLSSSFSTDTTINLAPNTDFSLVSGAITNPFYSYVANPQGFPDSFNFTPGATGSAGSVGAYAIDSAYARFSIKGKMCFFRCQFRITNLGSWSGQFLLTLPVPAAGEGGSGGIPIGGYIVAQGSNPAISPRGTILINIPSSNSGAIVNTGAGTSSLAWSGVAANDWVGMNGSYQI